MEEGFFVDLGRMRYQEAWDFQRKLWQMRVDEIIPNTLIFVEHEHVITKGKSADDKNLLYPPEKLETKGVDLHTVERGGDFTYHGPGQLVGYPIFHLKQGLVGIRPLVRNVEDSISCCMTSFGIDSVGSMHLAEKHPVGVWIGSKKIAAIGIAVKKWVSFHGFALNVSTDMEMFGLIVPCGLSDKGVTSMQEQLGREPDFDIVKRSLHQSFEERFDTKFIPKTIEEFK